MSSSVRAAGAALVVSALALSVAGCSASADASPGSSAPAVPVAIVVGAHANSPTPVLDAQNRSRVEAAVRANTFLGVVNADATPSLTRVELVAVKGTKAGQDHLVKVNMDRITKAMATPPDSDGADTWDGLAIASDAIKATGQPGTIIAIGSGLDDHGVLNVTPAGMLAAAPADVVAVHHTDLAAQPLKDETVVLTGTGYTTPPQQPLSATQRAGLVDLWQQTLTAAGATVVIDPAPASGASVETSHTVTPVVLPTPVTVVPASCQTTSMVFDSASAARFQPDRDVFVDPGAAQAALAPLAGWLAANPARTALLRGTTADDGSPIAAQKALGLRRAQVVAGLLTDSGVRAGQLTTVGVGPDFPEYTPDKTPTGALDPARAVANRAVRVSATDRC